MPEIEVYNDPVGNWMEIYVYGELVFSDHKTNFNPYSLVDLLKSLDYSVELYEKEFD